ncbi:MAG: hypothetical protein DMF60_17680, partial [Acidobacteria bacterium]
MIRTAASSACSSKIFRSAWTRKRPIIAACCKSWRGCTDWGAIPKRRLPPTTACSPSARSTGNSARRKLILNDELQARFSLIRALYKLKRNAEVEKEIADVLSWAKGGGTLYGIAGIQLEQKQYAAAAALYEKARQLRRGEEGNHLLLNLGLCYAKLNRLDDALKAWSELISSPDQGDTLNHFQDTLEAEGLNAATVKLIEARIARTPRNLVLYVFLAGALHDGGQDAAALDVFERAQKAVDKEKLPDLRNRIGDFLRARKLVEPAWQRYETNPTPLMAGALIRALNGMTGEKEKAQALAEKAAKFAVDDPQLQLTLADTLARLKQEAAAAAWYRKALGSTNGSHRIAAAKGLALTGGGAEAVAPLLELLKNRPQEFINDTNLLMAIAKTKNEAAIAEFLKLRSAWALNESETNYYRATLIFYSGRTNEAKPILTALTDAPVLTSI